MIERHISGRPEPEPMCHGCDGLEQEIERLREAGSKICEGFDEGYFVRNVHRDGESNWAIKLLPYLRAIAVFVDDAALHTAEGGRATTAQQESSGPNDS